MENNRETKNKFWKGVLVGAMVTAFSGLIVVGMAAGIWIVGKGVNVKQVQAIQDAQQPESSQDTSGGKTLDMAKLSVKMNYIQALIDKYYLFDEDMKKMEDWICTGMMYSLDDPYSVYYSAEDYRSLSDETNGTYCGIGVQASQNLKTGLITIVKVFKDSPAEEAGILPGDLLYKVDGEEVSGKDLSLLVNDQIKGEEGSTVNVEVYREDEEKYVEMDVERRNIEIMSVEYEMLENHVGYVAVSSFDEITSKQFKNAIDTLFGDGMEKMIIDLRNNGGGVIQAAEDMIDYILPKDKLVISFKGKGVPDESLYTKTDHTIEVPIVVLVNGESASASEAFAGALKDHDRATLVGTKTFGKGIAQGIFQLNDGSAVKITTAYYYTPSGECIHEKGIEPDVKVELKEELKKVIEVPKDQDNQLRAALDVLEDGVDAVNKELRESEEAEEKETEADDAA